MRSVPRMKSQILTGKICTTIIAPITAIIIPKISVYLIFLLEGQHLFLRLKKFIVPPENNGLAIEGGFNN